MQTIVTVFLLVLSSVVVILCVQNDEWVTLTLLAWSVVTPLWLVAVVGYALGMLSGWGVAGFLKRSWRTVTEPIAQ